MPYTGTSGSYSADDRSARSFTDRLKEAQVVYRILDQPIGNLYRIPAGFRYCVQGYFLPCYGSSFEFVNYNPLAQYRCLSTDVSCFINRYKVIKKNILINLINLLRVAL